MFSFLLIGSFLITVNAVPAAQYLPASECDVLCNCKTGEPFCATVKSSRLGPFQLQYPECLNSCFSTCCDAKNSSMMNPRVGMCSDNFYAEVVTGQHNGPVGLVEPCPGIFLAAVNVQKTS